ncbi:MAG TPA: PEP-CTERM sorting domain-containing protein [Lacipirellulaceae bacterium]|nr:PEP-CTERM sorting domain-containing protein [Lacipirellulaceae bacterium]
MNSIRRSLRFFCAALALSYVFSAGLQSIAGPINPNQVPTLRLQIDNVPNSWNYSPAATKYRPATDADGGYELATPEDFNVLENRAHVRIEELQFNPDPFVLNNILVTNTTTSTQIFSAFVGLPTTFPAPNFISGNVRTSVIDGGTDGATVATVAPTALYQAQIDGTTVATLQNHPFSVTAPVAGSNTLAASFGPTVNAVPVTSNIGIQLRFSLTAGDTAAILSRFDVTTIPEPASAALIGIGLAVIVSGASRRRIY